MGERGPLLGWGVHVPLSAARPLTPLPLCRSGNKGAVGISFMFNGTSFGFVNCHLTSGSEKTAR